MRTPAIFAVAAVSALTAGCAYQSTTTFAVCNASSHVVVIKTSLGGAGSKDAEFTLSRGRQKVLIIESTYCPEDYMPVDKYGNDEIIPPESLLRRLEIWVAGQRLPDEVRIRGAWRYFNTYYVETYTLDITDEMISRYLGK